jgi:predicted ATPase
VAARYGFLHALYQEVLYERLTARRRQRLHQQIGEQEEQAYGERAKEIAAELAVHFQCGRDYQRAVYYLRHAGEHAIRQSATHEALNHLTKGLELLKTLPDTSERAGQELALQIALGVTLIGTKGWAASETLHAYTRARELCGQRGDIPKLFPVLWGLWQAYATRAEYHSAYKLGEQLLTLAQRQRDPALSLVAHYTLGSTLYHVGEFASALAHSEQGVALYDSRQHSSLAYTYGQDFGISCPLHGAWALWNLGYPDQALQRVSEALARAQDLAHPQSLAIALSTAAIIYEFRRDGQVLQERANALLALGTEQGFPLWVAMGTILRGWALVSQGQGEEGIVQIRQGLAAWCATGAEAWRSRFLALLAEAYGKEGQIEEGLTVLAEALEVVHRTRERFSEAELYRLKGTLTLQSQTSLGLVPGKSRAGRNTSAGTSTQLPTPNTQEVEACFLKAIEIARKQKAKSWELRAVMSLARLRQQQGKKKEARQMLAEIYGWFTEGFDTKDLQEAGTLLEELA